MELKNGPSLQPTRLSPRKKISLAAIGTLGLSVCFHLGILLLAGGAVIIQGVIPKTLFETVLPVETANETHITEVEEPANTPQDTPLEVPPPDQAQPALSEAGATPDTVTLQDLPTPSFVMPTSMISTPTMQIGVNSSPISKNPSDSTQPKPPGVRTMISPFGTKGETKEGLTGHLYDMKQEPDQKPTNMAGPKDEAVASGNAENQNYRKVLADFLKNWNPRALEKFYKAPDPMGTFQVFIPSMPADAAPKAFDVEKYIKPRRWVIHYQGTVVAPVSTTFRFVGVGDDILVVRFERKIVLDGSLGKISDWSNDRKETVGTVSRGSRIPLYAGDWIKIEAGQSYNMEVLMGEQPGGVFYSFLFVQEKGREYKARPGNNGLILPVFQTASTKLPKQNAEGDSPTIDKAFAFGPPE